MKVVELTLQQRNLLIGKTQILTDSNGDFFLPIEEVDRLDMRWLSNLEIKEMRKDLLN